MFKTIRLVSFSMIVVAALALTFGAILYQAAFVSGADSDYTVSVTWWSALSCVLFTPSRIPFLALVGGAFLVAFTTFTFFRLPRVIGAIVLLVQATVGFFSGGLLGAYFLLRACLKNPHV